MGYLMKFSSRARLLLSCASCLLVQTLAVSQPQAGILVDQNAKVKFGYVLLQAQMTDPDTFFKKYAIPAEVEVSANGGHALVATFDKVVQEGVWDNNWSIVLKFPSMQAVKTWYHSPGYQAVVPYRRMATAYGNMVFFEGTPESTLRWQLVQYEYAVSALRFPTTLDPTPEYVVTLHPGWTSPDARVMIEAAFPEVDARGAVLAVDVKLTQEYINDGRLTVRVWLRNAAGQRRLVAQRLARNFNAGQWQTIEAHIDNGYRVRRRYDDDANALANVTTVELEFIANYKSAAADGDIAVRNLILRN